MSSHTGLLSSGQPLGDHSPTLALRLRSRTADTGAASAAPLAAAMKHESNGSGPNNHQVIPVDDGCPVSADESPADAPAAKEPFSRAQLARYKVDNWIALRRNQMKALVFAAFFQVGVGGLLLAVGPALNGNPAATLDRIFGEDRYSVFWMSWGYLVNPGNHIGFNGSYERTCGVLLTVLGVLYMSTVLGLVVDVIREKMDQLKMGRNVLEEGHSVILGWTDRAPLIIEEIILANESEGGGQIVVLADEPAKDVIEAEVHMRFRGRMLGTRVIVRHGSPMLTQDLKKVSVDRARSAIVLSQTGGDADKSDALALRMVLALKSIGDLDGFVLVEIRDVDNEPLVRLVGGDAIETLVSHDTIGRMMVMASRNPGLSRVYGEVLGFDGDEFYMSAHAELDGRTFGELQAMFPDAVPIGVASADENRIWLKPSLGRVMKPGEKVIVIAEDDDTYAPKPPVDAAPGALPSSTARPPAVETMLFCGWRRDIRDIIHHLDRLVMPGSAIHLCTDAVPLHERDVKLAEEGLDVNELEHLRIEHFHLNTSVRRKLEDLPLEDYTSVMIFPDQAYEEDMMHSDSHAIATLLLIRDIQAKRLVHRVEAVTRAPRKSAERIAAGVTKWRDRALPPKCPMICEILDPRTQATIEQNTSVMGSSDFCQSNRLCAQVLAMISENRGVKLLLDELLSPDGTSFYVHSAKDYVGADEALTFYDLAARCATCNHEILIGYQDTESLETQINPRDKSTSKHWHGLDLVLLRGDSRLQGQDRTQVAEVLEAFSNMKKKIQMDPEERKRLAKKNSNTAEVTKTLAKNVSKLRTEDLNWLANRVNDEIRTRNMKDVAPLALPLDPGLQTLIDDLAMVPARAERPSFNRIARIERPSFEAKNGGRPSFSNPYGDESTPRY